jgi:hypothetical protein
MIHPDMMLITPDGRMIPINQGDLRIGFIPGAETEITDKQ